MCLGCGEKRIDMKDASYKWRSTEPIDSERKAFGPMISFKVQAHLCEECAEESKRLRQANTSWDLTIWLMKVFFLFLIPAILLISSTELVPSTLGIEYAYIPIVLVMSYPYVALFITFHDARMVYLARSIPASAFITINPSNLINRSMSFSFRNEQYTSGFRQQNPTLNCSYTPSLSGYIEYPKRFPKMKAVAIVLPSLIALVLILLLLVR